MSALKTAPTRLVADIGGTNARFALVGPQGIPDEPARFAVSDHATLADAVRTFLRESGEGAPGEAAIAAAGPVLDGAIQLTNGAWRVDPREVAEALGGARVRVFNDLEAVALALPHLTAADIAEVAVSVPVQAGLPRIAVNVGTGLGAAVSVPAGDGWLPLATEAGHMRFAAAHGWERELLAHLESYEEFLSGPGVAAMRDGIDARLREMPAQAGAPANFVELFSDLLGRFAGDLVLATGAWGGVSLCGGVLTDWAGNVDEARFLTEFRRKGAMTPRMAEVPVSRILHDAPALIGMARVSLD